MPYPLAARFGLIFRFCVGNATFFVNAGSDYDTRYFATQDNFFAYDHFALNIWQIFNYGLRANLDNDLKKVKDSCTISKLSFVTANLNFHGTHAYQLKTLHDFLISGIMTYSNAKIDRLKSGLLFRA